MGTCHTMECEFMDNQVTILKLSTYIADIPIGPNPVKVYVGSFVRCHLLVNL